MEKKNKSKDNNELIINNSYPSAFVRRFIELVEQEEEHDSMHTNPPNECSWIITIYEEKLEGVNHDCNKLNHLKSCQVFLPPKVFLELWSHCSKQVICVHDDVYKCI